NPSRSVRYWREQQRINDMAFEFKGTDSRGVPHYVGGDEPPSPLVCAACLFCGAAILLLFLGCGVVGLEEGEPGKLVSAIVCGIPVFLLLLCGYHGWMRVSLAIPSLRPLVDQVETVTARPRINLDGEDLYEPTALPPATSLLRPAAVDSLWLRPVVARLATDEQLLHPYTE